MYYINYGLNNKRKIYLGLLRKSVILVNERIEFHNKLEEWLPRQRYWRICWRVTAHGWLPSTFRRRCDRKVPTLTIVQVVKNNTNLVFGGYATRTWAGYGKFELIIIRFIIWTMVFYWKLKHP
jgi:hypothetical protein